MGKITINCESNDLLPWKTLVGLQGKIKFIRKDNLERLSRSIIEHGISAPFFIYRAQKRDYIVDGHMRITALRSLEQDGHEIPERVPVDYVHARTLKEAREKLLVISSQYGDFDSDGVSDFMKGMSKKLYGEIRLPTIEIPMAQEPYFGDAPSLDEYMEPVKEGMICPKCRYTAEKSEFKK